MRRLPLRWRQQHLLGRYRVYSTTRKAHSARTVPTARPGYMDTSATDYSNWSNVDLIKRISELEAKLRTQNSHHTKTPSSESPVPSKRRPQKPPKPFDASRYSTRDIALKFAYLGKSYNGYEYHTNNTTPLPTIEEELWKALRKTHLIFPTFRDGQRKDEVCWDGCEYSKCGRTDKGVSAFGQVIGVRVRSSRPKEKASVAPAGNRDIAGNGAKLDELEEESASEAQGQSDTEPEWDDIKDELPYIQVINRVLPPDIRVLAWCPNPPPDFSARFSCRERRYRYFFTNPAYAPMPAERRRVGSRGAWLDIDAMRAAAKKLEGLHDFRNFCKIDGSKQISNFERRIFHADIKPVAPDQGPLAFLQRPPFASSAAAPLEKMSDDPSTPILYYFEVHGSAFLWHQVRHLVAVLFLVGQGYENPSIVDELLDVQITPSRPVYEMASDTPLVLWGCIFPDLEQADSSGHGEEHIHGYSDALDWIYAGDLGDAGELISRRSIGTEDRKYGSLSIMENLWSAWRKAKIDEVLAGSLIDVFARQGTQADSSRGIDRTKDGGESARVFDGSESPRSVGAYVPIMERKRIESPEIINARFAARKGWTAANVEEQDMNE